MKQDERNLKQWLAGIAKYYADSVTDGPFYQTPETPQPIWQMWWQGVDQSPALTRLWVEECSQESVNAVLTLLRLMHRPYNPATVRMALRNSFVHYLTRKYKKVPKGSNLEAFLAGDPVFST